MKAAADLNLPDDVKYTDEHIWVRKNGDILVAGISDFAQDQLGEVAYVDMPETGKHFAAHDEFGSIESIKAVNALFMPVAGEIVEINESLENAPENVNSACYGDAWLVKIKPDKMADVDSLLDAAAYRAILNK